MTERDEAAGLIKRLHAEADESGLFQFRKALCLQAAALIEQQARELEQEKASSLRWRERAEYEHSRVEHLSGELVKLQDKKMAAALSERERDEWLETRG